LEIVKGLLKNEFESKQIYKKRPETEPNEICDQCKRNLSLSRELLPGELKEDPPKNTKQKESIPSEIKPLIGREKDLMDTLAAIRNY